MNSKLLFKRLINNEISKKEFGDFMDGIDDENFLRDADAYLKKEFEKEILYYKAEKEVLSSNNENEPKIIPIKQSTPQKPKPSKKGVKKSFPDAAIILLLITVAFGVLYLLSDSVLRFDKKAELVKAEINPLITKSTPYKQMFRMKLADGSFVHMNAAGKITYPQSFNDAERKISLVGEAYFNIERDEKKPFVIDVKNYKVKVLGTSFNIQAYEDEDDFSVTVESGKVEVQLNDKQKPVILTENKKLIFNPETGEQKIINTDPVEELSWRTGVLRFKSTPMLKVQHMLERWYGVKITIADSAIYDNTLSGIHKNESIKSVLESISFATNTKYEVLNNSIVIKN